MRVETIVKLSLSFVIASSVAGCGLAPGHGNDGGTDVDGGPNDSGYDGRADGGPATPMACAPGVWLDAGQLCVDRERLGFGQEFGSGTFVGVTAFETVMLRNGGSATLSIASVVLDGGDGAFIASASWATSDGGPTPGTQIISMQSKSIQVQFRPTEGKFYSAKLTVQSNAENTPTKVFDVSGCGVPTDGGTSNCYPCRQAGLPCDPHEQPTSSRCCSMSCNASGLCQ